jgi:hypothetical protein
VVGRGRIGAAAIEIEVDALGDCRLQISMLLPSIDTVIEDEGDAMECDGDDEKTVPNVISQASSLSYRQSLNLASAMRLSCTGVAQ